MEDSTPNLDSTLKDDEEFHLIQLKSPVELADRFGTKVSLLILCIGLLISAIWLVSRPSFEKCSALEDVTERNTCYDQLRSDSLKPPLKGADFRY